MNKVNLSTASRSPSPFRGGNYAIFSRFRWAST